MLTAIVTVLMLFFQAFKVPSVVAFSSQGRVYVGRSVLSRTQSVRLFSSLSPQPPTSSVSFKASKASPDDNSASTSTWESFGLLPSVVEGAYNAIGSDSPPTTVQSLAISKIIYNKNTKKNHVAFAAATGSGKTLAYLLPTFHKLKITEEMRKAKNLFDDDYSRRPSKRPRSLILAPTRELAYQILEVCKKLTHTTKLSIVSAIGGNDKGSSSSLSAQKKQLNRPVDIVVGTPGRVLKLWEEQHLFLGKVEVVVVDEVDTMLEEGFQKEIGRISRGIFFQPEKAGGVLEERRIDDDRLGRSPIPPQLIVTTATMTPSVTEFLQTGKVSRKNKNMRTSSAIKSGAEENKVDLPSPIEIVTAPGLHKAVPRLSHQFIDVGNSDKIGLCVTAVLESLRENERKNVKGKKMVFCNSLASCRAVEFGLREGGVDNCLCYHGDLTTSDRAENLKRFRSDEEDSDCDVLVCTDIAARGLDILGVDHVFCFDFPLNAIDYLHRAGRTARGLNNMGKGQGKCSSFVAKRDKVLATAIEKNVRKGLPIDELTGRKSDYIPKAKEDMSKKRHGGGTKGVAKKFWFDGPNGGKSSSTNKKKKSKHRRS